MQQFRWDAKRETAARLIADGTLSDEHIAAEIGVERTTLHRWRKHPDFAAHVARLVAAYREAVKTQGIADKVNRLAAMNDRHQRLQQVIAARAGALADPLKDPFQLHSFREAAVAAGFMTGLVTLEWVTTPTGKFRPQFKVDTGLSGEMRNLEKQAAQEMGDWTEKREITGKGGGDLIVRVVYDDIEPAGTDDPPAAAP